MTNRFLISVAAAALIAGTGLANAQGAGTGGGSGAAGSAAQQSAPSSDRGGPAAGGAMQRDGDGMSGTKGAESPGMKGPDSWQEGFGLGRADAAGRQERAGRQTRMQGEKSKSMNSEDSTKGSKEMKAEGRDGKTRQHGRQGRKNGNMNAQTKGRDRLQVADHDR